MGRQMMEWYFRVQSTWLLRSHVMFSENQGKTVLVVDATSAVGCLAVQLVRVWGGSIISVVNQRKLAPLAQMLGSSRVIVIDNDDLCQDILEEELSEVGDNLEAVVVTSTYGAGDLPPTFYHRFLKPRRSNCRDECFVCFNFILRNALKTQVMLKIVLS